MRAPIPAALWWGLVVVVVISANAALIHCLPLILWLLLPLLLPGDDSPAPAFLAPSTAATAR